MPVPNSRRNTIAEILYRRMTTFHRHRVKAIAAGKSPLGKRDDGFLVVHLMPRSCVQDRAEFEDSIHFEGSQLKKYGHGIKLCPFEQEEVEIETSSRFNVDGYLQSFRSSQNGKRTKYASYTQNFRDGSVESVLSHIRFQEENTKPDDPGCLHDRKCEHAMFGLMRDYFKFSTQIEVQPPIAVFSALVGCTGVKYCQRQSGDAIKGHIDRDRAYLPEIMFATLPEIKVEGRPEEPESQMRPYWKLMRPWCDTLFQAMGLEKSINFNESGDWSR